MSVLYIAVPVAVLLALAAVIGFIWTVKQGQYDDLDSPAYRILEDDKYPQNEDDAQSD